MLLAQYLRSVLAHPAVVLRAAGALTHHLTTAAAQHLIPTASRAVDALSWGPELQASQALLQRSWAAFHRSVCNFTHAAIYAQDVACSMWCIACLQVVITDVDECLEALHENVSANLPSHCTLVASCLSQGQMAAAPGPCPASSSQTVAATPPESEMSSPACGFSHDDSATDTAAVQEPNALASSHECSSSNGAVEQQDSRNPSANCHTEVLVAELDWGRDASSVAPPFDVVLIADVVSNSIFTCKIWVCHVHFSKSSLHLSCCHTLSCIRCIA